MSGWQARSTRYRPQRYWWVNSYPLLRRMACRSFSWGPIGPRAQYERGSRLRRKAMPRGLQRVGIAAVVVHARLGLAGKDAADRVGALFFHPIGVVLIEHEDQPPRRP